MANAPSCRAVIRRAMATIVTITIAATAYSTLHHDAASSNASAGALRAWRNAASAPIIIAIPNVEA
jgi:hypothetical protein